VPCSRSHPGPPQPRRAATNGASAISDKPFDFELAEKKLTEGFIDQFLKLAEQLKATREVMRKDADSLQRRLAHAGLVRRAWKEVEESLPALIVEARADGYSVDGIAYTLGVTDSYVYRKVRDQQAADQ